MSNALCRWYHSYSLLPFKCPTSIKYNFNHVYIKSSALFHCKPVLKVSYPNQQNRRVGKVIISSSRKQNLQMCNSRKCLTRCVCYVSVCKTSRRQNPLQMCLAVEAVENDWLHWFLRLTPLVQKTIDSIGFYDWLHWCSSVPTILSLSFWLS